MDGIILHPRGVGYGGGYRSLVTGAPDTAGPDMAMFASSRADAYTFADWVTSFDDDRGRKVRVDRCYIDYRPSEHQWLQVKIVVEKEHKEVLNRLYDAITLRDGWCDEKLVKWAIDPDSHAMPNAMRLKAAYMAKPPELVVPA